MTGKRQPKSFINLIMEKFNAMTDFNGLTNRFSDSTRLRQLLSTNTLHAINNAAEHYLHGTLLMSYLNSIKITNKLTKETVSLDEAFEVQGKKLVLKKGFEFSEDDAFQVSHTIKEIVMEAYGNYDSKNQAAFQRHALGKSVFGLRKWLVRGTSKRWRGINTVFMTKEEADEMGRFYSEFLQDDKEGNYVTAIRFVGEHKAKLLKLKFDLLTSEWHNLTDRERSNIRRTIMEASLVTLSLFLALIDWKRVGKGKS